PQAQVHLQHHRSKAWNRPVQLKMAMAVPIKNPDPITRTDSELSQGVGRFADPSVTIGVGVTVPAAAWDAEDDLLVAMGPRGMPDQRRSVQLSIVAHGRGAALDNVALHSLSSSNRSTMVVWPCRHAAPRPPISRVHRPHKEREIRSFMT